MSHSRLDGKLKMGVGFFCLATLAATPAMAMDKLFAGPRAMGMGGTGVASVNDTTAQYYNPAAFGFIGRRNEDGSRIAVDNNNIGRKKWGLDLNAGGGYRLHNEFGSYLDKLGEIDLDRLSAGIESDSDLADLINLMSSLQGIAREGNGVTVDVTGSLGIRAGHFAVGARGFLQATGRVDKLDEDNLGLDLNKDELRTQMATVAMGDSYDSATYQFQVFTVDQRQQLAEAFGAGVTQDDEAIKRLDYMAAQEEIKAEEVAGTVNLLAAAIENSDADTAKSLDNNTTSVMLSGFGVTEIPFSYGHAINDHLSVGANFKLMRGRVYGNQILVFDEDADDILGETTEMFEESNSFGVDVGVMARYPKVNLGLIVRNLNSPKFNGFTSENGLLKVESVKIKPQATAGVAYMPFTTLTLEANLDLTDSETTLPGYKTRNLYLGLEWDAFRFLALRAGTYKNQAESDIGRVYTAGLGLNLWAMRLDVAGAFAAEKEEFDGDEMPRELRGMAQLSVDF
jgi:hypothetical protein